MLKAAVVSPKNTFGNTKDLPGVLEVEALNVYLACSRLFFFPINGPWILGSPERLPGMLKVVFFFQKMPPLDFW